MGCFVPCEGLRGRRSTLSATSWRGSLLPSLFCVCADGSSSDDGIASEGTLGLLSAAQ